MTKPPPLDPARAIFAAEYALDLLDDEQRAEASNLSAIDPRFAAEVARWEQEIAAWLEEELDEPFFEGLWDGIDAAIARGSPTAPIERRRPAGAMRWKALALAASLAAVGFASLWFAEVRSNERDRRNASVIAAAPATLNGLRFASVQSGENQRIVAAIYDRATGRFVARLAPLDTGGRVPELWLIGGDGQPKSLGPARPGQTLSITLPPELRTLFADGATMAISLEAPSTSPHLSPNGPILGTGKIDGI